MINISWEQYVKYVDVICQEFKNKALFVRDIDSVYGIPRGGVILAVLLSHKLNLKYIDDIKKIDSNVLVVDDIFDSGNTINRFFKNLNLINIKTAAIVVNEKSNIKASFYSFFNISNEWINFPYEDCKYKCGRCHDTGEVILYELGESIKCPSCN